MVNAAYLKTLAVIADSLNAMNKKIEKEDPSTLLTVESLSVTDNGNVIGKFVNDSGEWDFLPTSVSS